MISTAPLFRSCNVGQDVIVHKDAVSIEGSSVLGGNLWTTVRGRDIRVNSRRQALQKCDMRLDGPWQENMTLRIAWAL